MIFFVNQYLLSMNSGVEHAEFKRLSLFSAHGQDAKILTQDQDPLLHQNMAKFKISDAQVINLYDYFRKTIEFSPRVLKIEDLNLPKDYEVLPGNDFSQVFDGDRPVMNVYFVPGTVGHVYYLDIFDAFGNSVQKTYFDARGFKASDQFLNQNGTILADALYDLDGNRFMERFYQHENGTAIIRRIVLNDAGETQVFNNEAKLFAYFLDQINKDYVTDNTFIADRPGNCAWAILNMKTQAKRFFSLPTTHTINVDDQVFANLNPVYNYPLIEKQSELDGIIVATDQQKDDLKRWLGERAIRPIHVVTPALVNPEQTKRKPISLSRRITNQLLVVGRIDASKNVELIINAVDIARIKVPSISLVIKGYGPAIKDLKKHASELRIGNQVMFEPYTPDVSKAYDDAQIFIYAGAGDNEPLAMTEALSHGLPVIAIDNNYGPKAILKNQPAATLLRDKTPDELAQTITHALMNSTKLQTMSNEAYKLSRSYANKDMWQQWQFLFDK